MNREDALSLLRVICSEQNEKDVIPLQCYHIFDPSYGAVPDLVELRLVTSSCLDNQDFIKSVAKKHGLTLKTEGNFLVIYTPENRTKSA